MHTDSSNDPLAIADRWLRVIHQTDLGHDDATAIMQDTVENFTRYLNPGLLEYRKSVTEAGDFAATEWTGEGAVLRDVFGREWIDCLGGYGIFNLGWNPRPVLDAV